MNSRMPARSAEVSVTTFTPEASVKASLSPSRAGVSVGARPAMSEERSRNSANSDVRFRLVVAPTDAAGCLAVRTMRCRLS